MCIHHQFGYEASASGWHYLADGKIVYTLPLPALEGSYQLMNASCVIAAVESLQSVLPVDADAIATAIPK